MFYARWIVHVIVPGICYCRVGLGESEVEVQVRSGDEKVQSSRVIIYGGKEMYWDLSEAPRILIS